MCDFQIIVVCDMCVCECDLLLCVCGFKLVASCVWVWFQIGGLLCVGVVSNWWPLVCGCGFKLVASCVSLIIRKIVTVKRTPL